jgi:hypothetical protein
MDTAMIVYLCVFAVGFVFLLVSFIGGVEHVGFDHHFDVGHHDPGGGDHTINPSFFSAKVISCFLVGTGTGAVISHSWITPAIKIVELSYLVDFLIGFACGFFVGFICWWIVKLFLSQQASSSFSNDSFVGIKVPLRVGIAQNSVGEISADLGGQIRSLDVRSEDGKVIKSGSLVEVVRISSGIGIVRICK